MSVGAVNKNTGERIPTAGMPAIDSVLSGTSTNPVQNAIITAALANKQDKTDNSLQTTDKTVVGAINEHEGDIDSLKSGFTNYENQNNLNLEVPNRKNVFPVTLALLKYSNTDGTWSGNDYNVSGVTFSCAFNSDGYLTSITANGTSSSNVYFQFYKRADNPLHLDGSFVVSGGHNNDSLFAVGRTYNGAWQVLGVSRGSDSNPFSVSSSDDIGAYISIETSVELTDVMFYPMIRPATITDPTFAPYIPSVETRLDTLNSNLSRRYYYRERHRLAKNGGTSTIDISNMEVGRAYFIMCSGQYNSLWRYAGLLCITESNYGYLYTIESYSTLSVTVSGSTLTLTNNNEDNSQLVQVTIMG